MLIVVSMATFATPPPVAYAGNSLDPLAGKKYFADIGKGFYKFNVVKYCNDRHIFGEKKGKDFYLKPFEDVKEGEVVRLIYNMYNDKIDWGNKSYSKDAKKSWQWAQSLGIVTKKADPNKYASSYWFFKTFDRLAYAIDGSSSIGWSYALKGVGAYRIDVLTTLWQMGARNPGWDPRNL